MQFSQNIVKFKLNSETIVESFDEVFDFWFNSQDGITESVIDSYSVIQNKPNLGYFTQLAWAKSFKMGKNIEYYYPAELILLAL